MMADIGRIMALLEEKFQIITFAASKENYCGHWNTENKLEGEAN